MELTPKQLFAACAALFVGIVGVNFAQQWRSNENLKTRLGLLDLNAIKDKLIKQEMMEEIIPPEFNEADFVSQEAPAEET